MNTKRSDKFKCQLSVDLYFPVKFLASESESYCFILVGAHIERSALCTLPSRQLKLESTGQHLQPVTEELVKVMEWIMSSITLVQSSTMYSNQQREVQDDPSTARDDADKSH